MPIVLGVSCPDIAEVQVTLAKSLGLRGTRRQVAFNIFDFLSSYLPDTNIIDKVDSTIIL